MPVLNRIAEVSDEITAWRRDFHENPEILYEVHRTAGIVAEKLKAFGCDEVVEGIGRTGVVGVIRGKKPGRAIGLRADMDALPMQEITGLPHASKVAGKMHACGHDGHTAMLLGAAKLLAESRNFSGTAVVIFQPAEEGGCGGEAMVKDGMMERWGIEEVYGMHNMPGLPLGAFAVRPGPLLASVDFFDIEIQGRGGHAAKPHTTVDPILVGSQIYQAFQSIVSRNTDPLDSAVVSVTKFQGGTANNVIPHSVVLGGTVRTFNPATRDFIEKRMGEIVQTISTALGATATLKYDRLCPPTINHEAQTAFAVDVARDVAGADQVKTDINPIMGGEDFSFMLEARPGAFIFVGNGDTADCHHPAYDFDDRAIAYGTSYWVRLVEKALPA